MDSTHLTYFSRILIYEETNFNTHNKQTYPDKIAYAGLMQMTTTANNTPSCNLLTITMTDG